MSLSNIVSNYIKPIKDWYSKLNPATLTGAIDVIVVQQEDGTFLSSPFHVRFGKLGVLTATEKIVDIEVNNVPVPIQMKLDDNGAAYFVEAVDSDDEDEIIPPQLATSPIPGYLPMNDRRATRSDSCSSSSSGKSLISRRRIELITTSALVPDTKQVAVQVDLTDLQHSWQPAPVPEFLWSLSEEPPEVKIDRDIFEMDEESDFTMTVSESVGSSSSTFLIDPALFEASSRPDTPIILDPDMHDDVQLLQNKALPEAEHSWEWGQLPGPAPAVDVDNNLLQVRDTTTECSLPETSDQQDSTKETKSVARWSLSSLWRGQAQSGGLQVNQSGIYLDDIRDDDEETLLRYVGRTRASPAAPCSRDDDNESGKGASLPMSPVDSSPLRFDKDSHNLLFAAVDLSLCGCLDDPDRFSEMLFEQSKVSYDDFVQYLQQPDFRLFECPDLVVRMDHQYYKWAQACPLIMANVLYGRNLPKSFLMAAHRPAAATDLLSPDPSEPKPDNLKTASTEGPAAAATNPPLRKVSSSSWWFFSKKDTTAEEEVADVQQPETESGLDEAVVVPSVVLQPKLETRFSVATQTGQADMDCLPEERPSVSTRQRFKKSLRLSNEDINSWNLNSGLNEVQFSVTTAFQGTTRCCCNLFLWKYTDKIVISDIDGTITKSDVLGHVMPMIGRDWAQAGVASLFTKIVSNGYHIVYLSARAIGQASLTKDYLCSIRQGDMYLPDGPVFLNPTSLMNALHREVIEKKPEVFKIACLMDIRTLFPEHHNPFFAGYGNRTNDVSAYTAVGIPIQRIFTINHKGELRIELNNTFQASYESQSQIVDILFPPRSGVVHDKEAAEDIRAASPVVPTEFTHFGFWSEPIPELTTERSSNTSETLING